MYRPSGIAIVTAGLAGLALFHVIWGRDTRQTETWLQLDAPTSRAALDFGTTFLLHSGAWRAWAPVEEEAVKTPVALPAKSPSRSSLRANGAILRAAVAEGVDLLVETGADP